MKPRRAEKPAPVDGVTIIRRDGEDSARRRELVRLLLKALATPGTPGEGSRS